MIEVLQTDIFLKLFNFVFNRSDHFGGLHHLIFKEKYDHLKKIQCICLNF